MEVFGLIGMVFGMIGFIFGVISFVKIEKLITTLKENGQLEKEFNKQSNPNRDNYLDELIHNNTIRHGGIKILPYDF